MRVSGSHATNDALITMLFLQSSGMALLYVYEACSPMREMPTASHARHADVHNFCSLQEENAAQKPIHARAVACSLEEVHVDQKPISLHTLLPHTLVHMCFTLPECESFQKGIYVLLSRSITSVQSQNWRRNRHRDFTLLPALTTEHSRLTLLLTTTSEAGQVTPLYTLPS